MTQKEKQKALQWYNDSKKEQIFFQNNRQKKRITGSDFMFGYLLFISVLFLISFLYIISLHIFN